MSENEKNYLLLNYCLFFQKDFIMGESIRKHIQKNISIYQGKKINN